MPYAKSKAYTLENTLQQGEVIEYTVGNKTFSDRRIWLYKPYGFSNEEEYGLAIFVDGFEYLRLVKTKEILDHLIENKEIKPICALFVETTSKRDEE